jgi:protein SCO1/2
MRSDRRHGTRLVVTLAAAMLVAGVVGCGDRRSAAREAARPPAEAAGVASGESIYGLDLALIDQDGRSLRLGDLHGSVLVAAMMYSSCKSVCPRVTEDMKGIERQLGPDAARTRFVLFSLDPGRDTPAALTRFAREHGLDRSRWRLLAASEDGVRELAAVLGVKYADAGGGEIAHSAMIFVIDRDGVVRHRQVGLAQDPGELLAALRAVR